MTLQNVLMETARANAQAHGKKEGDYLRDGLLYCGVCREPRQCRVNGLPFLPFIDCACERAEKERAEKKRKEALLRWEIRENTLRCFQNSRQRTFTFAADDGQDPKLSSLARRYCDRFDEIRNRETVRGLLLFGPPGGGKTYIACAVCNELLGRGVRCQVAGLPEIVSEMGCRYDKTGFTRELCDVDLLVLDDFGVQRGTDYVNEAVFFVVNELMLARVPVIVTTNLTAEELKNPADTAVQRVTSRLLEMCFPYEVKGPDRRKAALKNNYSRLREILAPDG